MSLSLQSLPLDVLRKIASFLPMDTLLQLRGVNWYFHDVFVELVVGQPMGIYLQRDFDDSVFSLISKLSGVVGRITLNLKYFNKFLKSSTFVPEFDMLSEGKKKSIILTDSSADKYDSYLELHRIRPNSVEYDFCNFTHCFQRFLQLNSLQCITFWNISLCDLICKILLNCKSLKRISISHKGWTKGCHVCCSDIQSRARNHTFDCLSRHEETLEYLYVSVAFPLSSLHRMKKLRYIHIEMGVSGEIMPHSLPTKIERLTIPRPISFQESFNLMSNLHDDSLPHLKELHLTEDNVGDPEELQLLTNLISKIVRAAPNLEKVTLDPLLPDAIAYDTIDRDVVDNLKKLKQLTELKIGLGYNCNDDEYRLDLNPSDIRNNEAWEILNGDEFIDKLVDELLALDELQ